MTKTKMLHRAAERLFPDDTNRYGALPALLVLLTVVSGIVDAVSFLGLGHVFVANMTGNVVFLGFALAGASDLSARHSLLAVGSFVAGAWATGRAAGRITAKGRLFVSVTAAHTTLVGAALAVVLTTGHRGGEVQAALIALLGGGMGMQNAVVRRIAVPDLKTTVLTFTITGLADDPFGAPRVRRLASLAAMFTGALCGAALHLGPGPAAALAAATALLASVTVAALT